MPPFLMISNRNRDNQRLGSQRGELRFFSSPETSSLSDLKQLNNWNELTRSAFIEQLKQIAAAFPIVPDAQHEQQKHLCLFVHGYDNSWEESVERYFTIKQRIIDTVNLGQLILYSWPSKGSVAGYLPDREDARDSAPDLAQLLVDLHDHLIDKQREAAATCDPQHFCRAKISVIAHSMGNFVIQKALAVAAKRLNSPQLVSLVNQLIMVAADVDNDIFQLNKPSDSDGSLMANLCYRISALYTGLDQVLGMSAGLKHFGTRRLGRSGLSDRHQVWDNVFDFDVTNYILRNGETHSAVFDSPRTQEILRRLLRGVDRNFIADSI